MSLAARIEGVGLVGPGLAGWAASRAVLAGREALVPRPTVIPSSDMLPAAERRRAGKCVRLALGAGLEAAAQSGRSARDLVSIFASSSGDGENLHAICEVLASDDRMISPTRFHNSVHNAPAGYWGIATGSMHAADSIAALDASFSAGLLEAMTRLAQLPSQPVVLVAYDSPYPQPLHARRPMPDSLACALVMCAGSDARGATLVVETTTDPFEPMHDAQLEALRTGIPSARGLPLLALVAAHRAGRVVLEYLPGLSLAVELRP